MVDYHPDLGWQGQDGYYPTAEEARRSLERNRAYLDGIMFEHLVGDLLGKLGAKRVIHDAVIDGNQIDLVVEQELSTGTSVLTIVECKTLGSPVDASTVNAFMALFKHLHRANEADKAIIVSASNFTSEARQAAESSGVRLMDVGELETLAAKTQPSVKAPTVEDTVRDCPYVFIIMPFAKKFNDIYLYGITGAVKDAGMVCKRLDEIQFTGDVIKRIEEQIHRADIIVADITGNNPNVLYELGIAHTLGKPVALLVQRASQIPFDLGRENHVIYGGEIKVLQEKLHALLIQLKQDLADARNVSA